MSQCLLHQETPMECDGIVSSSIKPLVNNNQFPREMDDTEQIKEDALDAYDYMLLPGELEQYFRNAELPTVDAAATAISIDHRINTFVVYAATDYHQPELYTWLVHKDRTLLVESCLRFALHILRRTPINGTKLATRLSFEDGGIHIHY